MVNPVPGVNHQNVILDPQTWKTELFLFLFFFFFFKGECHSSVCEETDSSKQINKPDETHREAKPTLLTREITPLFSDTSARSGVMSDESAQIRTTLTFTKAAIVTVAWSGSK